MSREWRTTPNCLDPAQLPSLVDTLHAEEPWKIKVVPSFRATVYPMHDSVESFPKIPALGTVFVNASQASSLQVRQSVPFVLSKAGAEVLSGLVFWQLVVCNMVC